MKNKIFFLVALTIFFLLTPIAYLSADSISYTGCYELSRVYNSITLRMMDFDCAIAISGGAGQLYTFSVENLDPDFMQINTYDSGTASRSTNNLSFQTTITSDPQTISLTPWYEPTDDFYFVALGDNRPSSGTAVNPIFEDFLDNINVINPYFTLNAGDLVLGSTDNAILTEMFENFHAAVAESETPHFTVPGNHDDNDTDLDVYESYLGNDYYSFDFGNTHFAMANSNQAGSSSGTMADEVKTWLNTDLFLTAQTNKIVDFHHPLYLSTSPSGSGSFLNATTRNAVATILSDNYVDLLLAGHVHYYFNDYLDSTKVSMISNPFYQIVSGGAGQVYGAGENYYHITLQHVQGEQISHEVIEYQNFYISKENLNNNDGTEESGAITVSNDDVTDWEWIRLKYKLASTIYNVYAYDELGNYLTVHNKLFDSYHVAYVETSVPALSSKTITVAKKNKIHTGRTNVIDTNSEVSYGEEPVNSSTEVGLTASTSADTADLNVIEWEEDDDYTKKWTTHSNNIALTLNFNLASLSTGYLYQLKVNNKLYYKYYPDSSGNLSFSYETSGEDYTFELSRENTWWPNNIAIMPNSDGGPQVRVLDENGDADNQFYAYDQEWQGGYNILQADVDGDRIGEIIVTTQAGLRPRLKIFKQDGTLLASKKVFKKDNLIGLNVKTGDIDGNGWLEIIVAQQSASDNKIRIYRYLPAKEKIKLIETKRFYSDNQSSGINLEVADINNDGKNEVIAAFSDTTGPLKIYKYKNGNLQLKAQKQIFWAGAQIAAGNIDNKGRKEIAIAPTADTNQLRIYRFKNNELLLVKKKNITSLEYSGGYNIRLADLTGDFKDEVILAPRGAKPDLKIYKYNKQKFLEFFDKTAPYGNDFLGGINIGLADLDSDWDLELITATAFGSSNIHIYDYAAGKMEKIESFRGYSNDFTGGVSL